jgi:hypothetical protein
LQVIADPAMTSLQRQSWNDMSLQDFAPSQKVIPAAMTCHCRIPSCNNVIAGLMGRLVRREQDAGRREQARAGDIAGASRREQARVGAPASRAGARAGKIHASSASRGHARAGASRETCPEFDMVTGGISMGFRRDFKGIWPRNLLAPARVLLAPDSPLLPPCSRLHILLAPVA